MHATGCLQMLDCLNRSIEKKLPLDTGDIGRLKGESVPPVLTDAFFGLLSLLKVKFNPSKSTELGLLLKENVSIRKTLSSQYFISFIITISNH